MIASARNPCVHTGKSASACAVGWTKTVALGRGVAEGIKVRVAVGSSVSDAATVGTITGATVAGAGVGPDGWTGGSVQHVNFNPAAWAMLHTTGMISGRTLAVIGAEGGPLAFSPLEPPSGTSISWPGLPTWLAPIAVTWALPCSTVIFKESFFVARSSTPELRTKSTPFAVNFTLALLPSL